MYEHLYEILAFFFLGIVAILARKFLKMLSRSLDLEEQSRAEDLIDKAVEEAVRAIEEEARAKQLKDRPKGKDKQDMAIGIASMILRNNGIEPVIGTLISKVDATVHRLFRK